MVKIGTSLVAAIILLIAAPTTALGLESESSNSVRDELTGINKTLKEIVHLLDQQVATQRLALYVSRTEAAVHRVQTSERELENLRERYGYVEQSADRMQRELRSLADRDAAGELGLTTYQMEETLASMEIELTNNEEEGKRITRRIAELENRIAEQERMAEMWQDLSDKNLRDIQ